MSGRGINVEASAPSRRMDSTWLYNVGPTPHSNVVVDRKANTDKFIKDLLIYGVATVALLYVIYGKK